MAEFIENNLDMERWVKIEDPEILKKVDINYPDSHMRTNWLAEVRDIDENGELFESSPARYILSIHGGLNGNGNWSTYILCFLKDSEVLNFMIGRMMSLMMFGDLKLVLRS